MLIKVIY